MWPFDKIVDKLCSLFDETAKPVEKPTPAIPPRPAYMQDVPIDTIWKMVSHVITDERHGKWHAARHGFFSLQDQIGIVDRNMHPETKYDHVRENMVAIGHQLQDAKGQTALLDLRDFKALYDVFSSNQHFPDPRRFEAKRFLRPITERNSFPPEFSNRQRVQNFQIFRENLCETYETVLLPMQMRTQRINRAQGPEFRP